MLGMLIFVSGLSGAGKTTLVRAALLSVPSLTYLQTTTTRPRREGEAENTEYQFVSDDDYEALRAASPGWDHTIYGGYKYGANVNLVKAALASGNNKICAVAPDLDILKNMEQLYHVTPVTIWVNTSAKLAQQRIAHDTARAQRVENDSSKGKFDYIFTPTGVLTEDASRFTALVQKILS